VPTIGARTAASPAISPSSHAASSLAAFVADGHLVEARQVHMRVKRAL